MTLPVAYSDLPRDAQLCITLFDCAGPGRQLPVGGTTISLFGKHGVFRQGMLDLRVWPGVEADGNYPTSTPGKARDHGKEQMQRLAKLAKKHRNGQMSKVDWLDRLTFREIELINEREKRASEYLYLMLEFPEVTMDNILVGIHSWNFVSYHINYNFQFTVFNRLLRKRWGRGGSAQVAAGRCYATRF